VIRSAWRNDSNAIDVVLVTVLGIALLLAARSDVLSIGSKLNLEKTQTYANECTILAAVLGFLIAGTAIIASSAQLKVIKEQRYELFKRLASSFRDSIYSSVAALTYSFIASIFDQSKDDAAYLVLAVALFMLVILRVVRAARRLYQTLII
jgi:hypothetical protein